MEWTRHPFLKVITALKGRGDIRTQNGVKQELSPGRIAMVPPGVEHRLTDRAEEPLLIYILCVGAAFPVGIPGADELRLINDPAATGRALRCLREIASLSKPTGNSGEIGAEQALLRSGLVATLLGRLLSESHGRQKNLQAPDSKSRVKALIARLPDEFFDDCSTDKAAMQVRLSRRRFTQLFSELAGESYSVRVRSLRLAHACRLLRGRDISPVTVAFECGYGEISTFYRDFKRHMGMPPAAWGSHQR